MELGLIAKPHGVRGELNVRLHNARSAALLRVNSLTLVRADGSSSELAFNVVSQSAEHVIIALEGIKDRAGALALRGASIRVERAALAPPAQGEYFYQDLIGCQVLDEEGQSLGCVTALFEAGASDVLVVRDAEIERYLPLVEQWIGAVDLEDRVIRLKGRADDWESWEV